MFHVVVYVEVSCKDRVSEQQLSTEHIMLKAVILIGGPLKRTCFDRV